MTRLSLVAVLLLALAPSISRLLPAPGMGDRAWAELCTVQGLKWIKVPGAPAMPDHGGGDCAYCPLLQSLDSAVAAFSMPPASIFPPVAPSVVAATLPARWIYPSGLGSRGPPTLA